MPVTPTQTDYEMAQLPTRNLKIKVDVLNFRFQTVDSIEGILTDGSISVDANSDIRRTCSVTLTIKQGGETLIKPGGNVWLDRYIKIYQGMDNPRNKNRTIWWNMGIFLVNSPTSAFDVSTHSLSFEGLDLMAKLSDKRGGQLPAVTTIVPAGSKVSDVVHQSLPQFGGFHNSVIEDEGLDACYDIKT